MAASKTIQTKFAGKSPFAAPKPPRVRKCAIAIDINKLEIADDKPGSRSSKFKYDHIFEQMKTGQCIRCHSSHTSTIAASMREWAKRTGQKVNSKQQSNYSDTEPKGRVWKL